MKAQDARPLGGGPQPSLRGCPGLRFPGRQVSHQAGLTSGMLVTGASGPVRLLQDWCLLQPSKIYRLPEAVDPGRQPCLPPWLPECPDPWSLLHGPLEP